MSAEKYMLIKCIYNYFFIEEDDDDNVDSEGNVSDGDNDLVDCGDDRMWGEDGEGGYG